MTDWNKYPINHLCSKCNKEYSLPIEVNNAGATAVFANCPYCDNREQLWIRIPWYTDIIRAYEESLVETSKRMEEVCPEYPDECDGQDLECKRKDCPWYAEKEPPI